MNISYTEQSRFKLVILALLLPFTLYIIGLNPYVAPETYDDVVYLQGAASLANFDGYRSLGQPIVDWPPLLSVYLAIPMWLGLQSVWVAKLLILLTVALGMVMIYRYLDTLKRPHVVLICVLMLLLPNSLIWGTRVMTEWPYILLSFSFLFMLHKVNGRPYLSVIVLSGLLFAACLLTRYAGVLLFAALVAQAWERYSKRKPGRPALRYVMPEMMISAIGVGIFAVVWLLPMLWMRLSGEAASKYYQDMSVISSVEPLSLFGFVLDLFFQERAFTALPFGYLVIIPMLMITVLVMWGFVVLCYQRVLRPGDWYVVAWLIVFAIHDGKYTRYLLPIAPLVLSYFFLGAEAIYNQWLGFMRKTAVGLGTLAICTWIVYLAALDVYLLIKGNGKAYSGISYLASPTPEQFYLGDWLDLYLASHQMKEDSIPGPFALYNVGARRYAAYFSGRPIEDYWSGHPYRYLLLGTRGPVPEDLKEGLASKLVFQRPAYSLYLVSGNQTGGAGPSKQ